MDYHFYNAPSTKHSSIGLNRRKTLRFVMAFLPIFAVSLTLPVIILSLQERSQNIQTTQASSDELDIWIEPANVIAQEGQEIELTVFARHTGSAASLANLQIGFLVNGQVDTTLPAITYANTFTGKIRVGSMKIVAQGSSLKIEPDKNRVSLLNPPEKIDIKTSYASVEIE